MNPDRPGFPLCAVILLSVASIAQAATIGYWRFEGDSAGFLSDSSGSGRTLTAAGTSPSVPVQAVLPESGPGSAFPDPIAGQANTAAATFDGNNTRFFVADENTFTDTTFTVEALVNYQANGNQKSIMGHWNSTGNQRSWLLAVNATNQLNLLYSTSGSDTNTAVSALPALIPGRDYFLAAAVNLLDTSTSGITFYVQDLTAGTALQVDGVAHALTSLKNAATPLTIGATGQPSSPLTGWIDEVRYSDSVLTADQLLVPEPSGLALLGAGLLLAGRRRRR